MLDVLPTSKRFAPYFALVIVAFFGLILLARATFPEPYTILSNSVSNLGRADINVNGWFFFSAALWFVAVALIPVYATIYRIVVTPRTRVVSIITMILYALTSTGLFMAGTFQEGSSLDKLHLYSAYLGFGGFFVAGLFTWGLVGTRLAKYGEGKGKLVRVLVLEIIILGSASTLFLVHLVLNEIGIISFSGNPIGPLIGFPFTEWMLVIAIFADKVLLAIIIVAFLKWDALIKA